MRWDTKMKRVASPESVPISKSVTINAKVPVDRFSQSVDSL